MPTYPALVTADLHLNDNPRDSYRHDFMLDTLPKYIRQFDPKYLIILGDLTDEKDRHCAELVNAVVDYLHKYTEMVKEVIILRGNHDCLDPTQPFFGFVNKLPNVTWITNPEIKTYPELGICTFLPHTRDYKKDWAQFNFAPYKRDPNCGWIFCHNTFDGAVAGGNRKLSGIPADVFPSNAKVLSGDIHVPQKLGSVTYVGAPYTITFGDTYKPRIRMLTRNNGKLRIDTQMLLNTTQKRTIEITNLAKLDKHIEEFAEGDLLKLKVHLKAEEYPKWNEIKIMLREWADKNGGLLCEIQPVKQARSIRLNRKAVSTKSDAELLQTYVKRKGIDLSFLKTGIWLMEKT